MSIASQAIRLAAPAFNVVHADLWTILSGPDAGTTFFGDAQTEAPIAIDSDLGSDAREKTMLFVDRPTPTFKRGQIISGIGSSWRLVGDVDDNPANDRVKFEIVKVVAGKDT
jgi:hypothetical protein